MNGLLPLAFGAGLLAPVNPCGFGLLPAVLTATVEPNGSNGAPRGLGRRLGAGLRAGLALSIGFCATVTLLGLALTAGVRSVITLVPWLTAAFGVALTLTGLAMLAGWHLPLRARARHPDTERADTTMRMIGFGAGYAIASVSCSIAVLLAVVTQAAATTPVGVIAVFTAYAAGSAILLTALALFAAAAGGVLTQVMRRVARYATRIGGAVLALSGIYLLYYWLPPLLGGVHPADGGLGILAAHTTTWISTHQLAVVAAAGVLLIVTVVLARAAAHRATTHRSAGADTVTDEPR